MIRTAASWLDERDPPFAICRGCIRGLSSNHRARPGSGAMGIGGRQWTRATQLTRGNEAAWPEVRARRARSRFAQHCASRGRGAGLKSILGTTHWQTRRSDAVTDVAHWREPGPHVPPWAQRSFDPAATSVPCNSHEASHEAHRGGRRVPAPKLNAPGTPQSGLRCSSILNQRIMKSA